MIDKQEQGKYRIVVAGGGTAGHIEPAMAVAEALRDEYGAVVTAIGSPKGLEKDLVPARGFDLQMIDPVPVPRKPSMDLVKLPFRVVKAVNQARAILKNADAQALIGFGGYVSAPAYIAAKLSRVPFFIHETNARAGMANKLGVKLGGVGFNAMDKSGMKGEVIGVPIRSTLTQLNPEEKKSEAYAYWNLDPNKKTILVTGGSQGAQSINKAVSAAASSIVNEDVQILHAVGKKNELPESMPGYHPVSYIDRMDLAYAIADLVVCRAGALTVAENTAANKAAIYVPLPHGNGEQALNALPVVDAGGAVLIDDQNLTPELLTNEVNRIINDDEERTRMVEAARSTGFGDATGELARRIIATVDAQR